MKKKDIIELIKYHTDENDSAFRKKAYEIATIFDKSGDSQLAEYIMSLLSDRNAFMPQGNWTEYSFLNKINGSNSSLYLPDSINNDISGLIYAINRKIGVHKILFEGAPGTGKTEAVYRIASLLNRDLYLVDSNHLIDSKLGQTAKNLSSMFNELNALPHPDKVIIMFDEIDALALDRINSNDLREMGRVTSTLLKELDGLSDSIVIIATTNLYNSLDRALVRRFDVTINFDRYTQNDLRDVFMSIFDDYSKKLKVSNHDNKLLRKILSVGPLPLPGDMNNIIKASLAFSGDYEFDYLKNIYIRLHNMTPDVFRLHDQGFTVREIGVLLNKPKTTIARILQDDK